MTNTADLKRAAADIYSGLQRGEHFPPAWRGKFDLDAGYAIQLAVRGLRAANGDAQVGWKVGLTAEAIREMEKFDEPIFAVLFESVAWLANKLARFGEHIEAGQAIMSGSFTIPTALHAGDHVQTRFTTFGAVSVQVV